MPALGAGLGPDEALKLGLRRRQRLDVVGQVVSVAAREGLAPAHRALARLGVQHLHSVVVIWVDDSADIEEVRAAEAVPANFTEHTGLVLLALRHGVPVAYPSVGEGGYLRSSAGELHRGYLRRAFLRGEDDFAVCVVLRDHVDGVGRSGDSEQSRDREGLPELHCGGWLLRDLVV